MSFDSILKQLSDETDKLIDELAPTIIAQSEANPRELENLTTETVLALTTLWQESIDTLAMQANQDTNEATGEQMGSSITDADKEDHLLVGGYFFLESMRRAFTRIHGTNIALQISDDEREDEVDTAIERSKSDVTNSASAELAFAFGVFTKLEQTRRGIEGYTWITKGDSRVRPTHQNNANKIFSWQNPPATGHPGTEHNCRCTALPQLLQGKIDLATKTQKPTINGLSVKMLATDKARIDILGYIGDDWDGLNTTDWQIRHALPDHTVAEIDVYINSEGGDVSHGLAIYNYLKQHPAKINTYILGNASSAASLIFLAGENRYMPAGTFAVIHNPWSCFCGDHNDAERSSALLRGVAEAMIGLYAQHLSISYDEIKAMLDREEVLYTSTALAIGFATASELPSPESIDTNTVESRVASVKASIAQRQACFVNSLKNGVNMSNTTKPDGGAPTVTEIQAKYDVLAHKNTELTTENTALKAQVKKLEEGQVALWDQVRAELLAEQQVVAEVQAKAKSIGVAPEGDTPVAMMTSVIKAKGVKNTEAFTGETLKAMFDYVIGQYSSAEADNVYALATGKKQEDAQPTGTWDKTNKFAKGGA